MARIASFSTNTSKIATPMREINAHKQAHKLLISSQANHSHLTSEDKEKSELRYTRARVRVCKGLEPRKCLCSLVSLTQINSAAAALPTTRSPQKQGPA